MFDTSTNLGLGLVVTYAVTGVFVVVGLLGFLLNKVAARFDSAGDV